MRTHILIAALVLSAGSAIAAPRSLTTQAPVTPPPTASKIQILEAPQPVEPPAVSKVQVLEAPAPVIETPKAAETIVDKPAAQAPAPADPGAARAAPAEEKPVAASPVQPAPLQAAPAAAPPAEAKPVEAATVEPKPVEAVAAPQAKPVKQVRRKHHHREASVKHRIDREIRGIERTINRHLGGITLAVPVYVRHRHYTW
jgi:hypothetical protein